ncbi:MAG: hypothetical protein KAU48_11825 [Candidatus Thorarchaeota archaeon]|nr:hypothetical protein [Candidatus Thorarchaeota archaeon]
MKFHHIQDIHSNSERFQRFGHLSISDIDSFIALLTYRIGHTDSQSQLHISSSLIELRWSRRGLVIVYIEKEERIDTTEILYDCTDSVTWFQILDVLGLICRLAE